MRYQAMHDLRVDEWNKRIVIPMQNEGRLPQFVEPGNAGPTHSSQHLVEVAEQATRAYGTCKLACILGLRAHLPSVDFSGDLHHVGQVLIASWRGYLRQDR